MIINLKIITSCLIYFFCFACPSISVIMSSKLQKHTQMLFLLISLIPATLLTTLRYGIANDYFHYNQIFTYVKESSFAELLTSHYPREFGFKFVIKLLQDLPNPLIFGFFGLFTLLPVILFLKKEFKSSTAKIALGIFFYMFCLYPLSFNTLRQCLACTLVLVGTSFLFSNRKKIFYFYIILASSFHFSACFAFIIAFFWDSSKNKSIGKKRLFFFILLVFIVLLFWPYVLYLLGINAYLRYAIIKTSGSNNSFWIKFLFTILLLLFNKRLIKYNYKNSLYIDLNIITTVIYAFGFIYPYIVRSAWYFEYFNIILISSIPYSICKNNFTRCVCILTIISFCVFWFFGVECGLVRERMSSFLPIKFIPNL